jgi:Tautomerase enzyme
MPGVPAQTPVRSGTSEGRSDELKKALLADLNRRLVETADVRPDDVFVSMYEVGAANVSFGRGLAQRAP